MITPRRAVPAAVAWAAIAWTPAFLFSLGTYTFSDDHFGRISPARQIARYGELPFRDFFDPGYVLTELASAALQRLLGDNLLGEMLLTSSFVALGAVAILLLVRRATASWWLGLVTAAVAVLTFSRAYDYDKFLFYPLGLLVCWRYIDSRATRDLAWMAAVAVVAGMFRYDNGLFVGICAVVAVGVVHMGEWSLVLRRLALLAGLSILLALPYTTFLQVNGGLVNAVDQMTTYARHEGARTHVGRLPSGVLSELRITPSPPPPSDGSRESWRRRLRRRIPFIGAASVSWSSAGASAAVYYLMIGLSIGALAIVSRTRVSDPQAERARIASAAAMSLLAVALVLREPVSARLGGVIAPSAVLAAWAWHRGARLRVTRVVIAACVLATLAVATDWRWSYYRLRNVPLTRSLLAGAVASPPPTRVLPKPRLAGLGDYLRRCTGPADRVFAGWFAPELYFCAGRAFAGGMVVTFGDHWSRADHQRRLVARLESESVPVVLLIEGARDSFRRWYTDVDDYLRANYHEAAALTFGDPDGTLYAVLTRNGVRPAGEDPIFAIPCFVPQP